MYLYIYTYMYMYVWVTAAAASPMISENQQREGCSDDQWKCARAPEHTMTRNESEAWERGAGEKGGG